MPIVIRIPYAGGIGGVEHHCDSSEAYYAHTPGLKVVTPATVEDAYSLLREAIDDPDPVVFLEPKKLYWSSADVDLRGAARRSDGPRSGGPAGTRPSSRTGRRCRSRWRPPRPPRRRAATSRSSTCASIVPFDDETVTASVRRTGRCVVVQEAQGFAGVGAEIAARVQERCFHSPARAGAAGHRIRHPLPAAEARARSTCPSVDRILDAVDRLQWDDDADTRWLR